MSDHITPCLLWPVNINCVVLKKINEILDVLFGLDCGYSNENRTFYIQHIAFKHNEWYKRINIKLQVSLCFVFCTSDKRGKEKSLKSKLTHTLKKISLTTLKLSYEYKRHVSRILMSKVHVVWFFKG